MIVGNNSADQFVRRPPSEITFFLVHGNDDGLIRERAGRLAAAALGDNPDPLRLVRLDGEALVRAPGILADEAMAISMFGGSRVIWVNAQGRDLLPALAPLFRTPLQECTIVVEAGSLKKGHELRSTFERLPNGASIECYPDDRRAIASLIDEEARAADLRVPPDVRDALCELLGADRMTTRNEIVKLMLYARGRGEVAAEDVQAIVSEAAPSMLDEAIDATFAGDRRAADKAARRYLADGGDAAGLLSAAIRHATLLHKLRVEVDSGRTFDSATQSARVRIFFQRRATLERQVSRWTASALAKLFSPLYAAANHIRQDPRVAEAASLRALWAIASSGRAGRT
ncbi:MAG TPA: DNA polymerase III subunit delta [Roseiarcus sp.]|nr:DNA polymerase III subunit delta [Roseiarcus sp.]